MSALDLAVADPAAAAEPLLVEVRRGAVTLVEQLKALQLVRPEAFPSPWEEHIAALGEVIHFLDTDGGPPVSPRRGLKMSIQQRRRFGRLLRDRRNAAKLSRQQLAQKAQISAATVKFIETARHHPSRASLSRLINVPALRLSWADVPGQPYLPIAPADSRTGSGDRFDAVGSCLMILDRIDFDELGDPVSVRRLACRAQAHSGTSTSGPNPFRQDGCVAIDFVPLRR